MGTFLFSEHVFGPIQSRRLGSSLGINLLSTSEKICNYDCIYCECGATHAVTNGKTAFVDKNDFLTQLEARLKQGIEKQTPIDAITFAGNGEPTLHPNFLSITKEVVRMRDTYYPNAKIAVLTNGMTLNKQRTQQALNLTDKAIIKLDAGSNESMQLIDQPKGKFHITSLIDQIQSYKGEVTIQTMFLKGSVNGIQIDNTAEEEVDAWVKLIDHIHPKEVMLYSIDRDTPLDTLEKVSKKQLEIIAQKIEHISIKTQVV